MIDAGLAEAFVRGITPPEVQSLLSWAENNYYLPPESAAEPGLISFDRTPYSKGILDVLDGKEPNIDQVALMMAAQLAKTTILLAFLGKVCATPGEGAPILFMLPSIEVAEMISKERFAPMIQVCPALQRGLVDNRRNATGQTTLQKRFTNGTIVNFVSASVSNSVASRPVKYLLADEISRFSATAGKDGNPLALGMKRLSTFKGNGALSIVTSTPLLSGICEIERHWLASDKRKYFVPCPHCSFTQTLEFERITWEGDDWETATYSCPECGVCWTEADRLKAIADGEWIRTAPEVRDVAGFQLNGLYSPWVGSWSNAAREFISSRGDPMLEQVFTNTFLGQPHKSADLEITEQDVIDRMSAISLDPVPKEVLALTSGCDVQRDRIEVLTVGWSEHQAYFLDHTVIHGDTSGDVVWNDLHEFLSMTYQHELGETIKRDCTGIDSGYLTQTVMDFVTSHPGGSYYALKGVSGERLIIDKSKQKRKNNEQLWLVGVDSAKTNVMERLKISDREAHGYIHIADMALNKLEFAKQLLSEYRDVSFVAGRPVLKWVRKKGTDAEVLDTAVYASAMRTLLKPNWANREIALTRVKTAEQKAATTTDWGAAALSFD